MRLVGKEQKFIDNSEKSLYELEILMKDTRILSNKIAKLERFKKITFESHDIKHIDKKIARYQQLLDKLNESGDQYIKLYYKIWDAKDELANQRAMLMRVKAGKLHYLNKTREQIKTELNQNITQLEKKLNHLLYNG